MKQLLGCAYNFTFHDHLTCIFTIPTYHPCNILPSVWVIFPRISEFCSPDWADLWPRLFCRDPLRRLWRRIRWLVTPTRCHRESDKSLHISAVLVTKGGLFHQNYRINTEIGKIIVNTERFDSYNLLPDSIIIGNWVFKGHLKVEFRQCFRCNSHFFNIVWMYLWINLPLSNNMYLTCWPWCVTSIWIDQIF